MTYFKEEKPSPSGLAMETSSVKETVRKESRQDIGHAHHGPEKAKA